MPRKCAKEVREKKSTARALSNPGILETIYTGHKGAGHGSYGKKTKLFSESCDPHLRANEVTPTLLIMGNFSIHTELHI